MFKGFYNTAVRSHTGRLPQTVRFDDPTAPVNPEQLAWEFEALLDIYRRLKPMRVIEIGSYRGGSLYQWLKYAPPGATVVAIDLVGGPWGALSAAEYVEQWHTWAPLGVRFARLAADSREESTREQLLGIVSGLDFVFIDGDHRYEGARADFELYGPLVRAGGVIAFHDILKTDEGCGIYRLWREIREAGYITQELYARPEQGDMGIGVIYVKEAEL